MSEKIFRISLRELREEEFVKWKDQAIKAYAHEKMTADGYTWEVAKEVSEESFRTLLPDGLKTRGQHLFAIVERDPEKQVGVLWFGIQEKGNIRQVYVYDIVLDDAEQGKGYGSEAMTLLEDQVKSLGHRRIALHVFGHNSKARHLYGKLGYQITNLWMFKELE